MDESVRKQIELEWESDSLIIIYSWFSLFPVFLNFIMFPATILLAVYAYKVPIFFVVLGCFIWLYMMIRNWVNKTHIVVSKLTITVQHKPLFSFGNKKIKTRGIKRVYSKLVRAHRSISFGVFLQTDAGSDIALFDSFYTEAQALYVAKEIEEHLNITTNGE